MPTYGTATDPATGAATSAASPPRQVAADAPRSRTSTSPLPWAVMVLALLGVALWQSEAAHAPASASGDLQARRTATYSASAPPAARHSRRWLRFEDRPNGDVAVIDALTGREAARYQGEQGFLRGTLRAVARERSRHGVGPQQPLELVAHDGGRLSLFDPATGQRIALESFGASNLAVFAALLDDGPALSVSPRSPP